MEFSLQVYQFAFQMPYALRSLSTYVKRILQRIYPLHKYLLLIVGRPRYFFMFFVNRTR